jgi:hypothetical protein
MQTRLIEVACDESGFSGTNLLDVNTEVFTHASVHLSAESAGQCVDVVRARFPYSSTEYKSSHLFREKQRPALEWLLGPSGPLYGRAHVHLTDKTYLLVARVIDLLVGEPTYAARTSLDQDERVRSMALALYRQGPVTFGQGPWRAFLEAFKSLLRDKPQRDVDAFFHAIGDDLERIGEIVELLRPAPPRLACLDDRGALPLLEPLIPALVETALYWGAGGRSVFIVHDEQSALTAHRVSGIQDLLGPGRLLGVRLVDSRSDPRVQVADFLAGAARRIATQELRGRGDAELAALLRPYVDPFSIWADAASWEALRSRRESDQVM